MGEEEMALPPPSKSSGLRQNGHFRRDDEEVCISPTLCGGQWYSSEESALDNDPSLMLGSLNRHSTSDSLAPLPSGGSHHPQNSAACFHWPPSSRLHGTAEERAAYFSGLQKRVDSQTEEREPWGQQATTLLDLMTIRAFHSKELRRYSLGAAVGFRTRKGLLTNIPAIIVFVARKVHNEWLDEDQRLPNTLQGPGGIWCDVDVVEFSCYGASAPAQKEEVNTELVEGLRGNDPCIGPGSQVASQETYGTLGAIVRSRTGARQVGFLTNRHVAVNLDYPNQKMFHPLPPNLGQGVYLGAVERATSFITDDLWYGIFTSTNPETFVRADGAFIPFADRFDISKVATAVKGVGGMGDVMSVDLQASIDSIVGKQVIKVGRSSGLTTGSIMAYALEYDDEKGVCVFTDFLIVGENGQTFDLEGDSGSLILVTPENGEKPRPIGIIWGGTANRGRLKLRNGHGPENWTIGVDLGKLLDRLQLDLIASDSNLEEAMVEQHWAERRLAMGSSVAESSPVALGLAVDIMRPNDDVEMPSFKLREEVVGDLGHGESSSAMVELELMEFGFGLTAAAKEKGKQHESSSLASNEECEDLSIGFSFSTREAKRRKQS